MLATRPPSENPLAVRGVILGLVRDKLAPLFPVAEDLDALPAWLWSLPAHVIARSLPLDAGFLARELALKLDAETESRHPAERFVAYLAEHRPHLSNVQRARLAEFAQALQEERGASLSVDQGHMIRRGFSTAECERLAKPAFELIDKVAALGRAEPGADSQAPADMLRAAGTRAHARRAFAEGDLELDAAAAARATRPAAASSAGAAR